MVYRGDGARGLLDYLAGKDNAYLLATNLDGASPQAFARQIGEVRRLHPKEHLARPVCHIPLRPVPGEDLTNEEWEDVLQHTLERMGFANSPYVAYLHDHGDGRHLHIATYRVTFEGRLVSDANDRLRVMAVAREIEEQFGLATATAKRSVSLTRPALERLLRDPERAGAMAALRLAVDQAASRSDTLRGFLTELNRLGIRAELKVARKTGAVQGFTLALPDGSILKGSDLGKTYSLARICNRHELRLDLKPEGPVLVATEVSDREHKRLESEGLEADHAVRYGSRRTLYWQLPPGNERAFADLVALRLPHRFLTTADELPGPPPSPARLEDRARRVRLLAEMAELGPSLAPPLPGGVLRPETPLPAPSAPGFAEQAQRCQALSAALVGEDPLPTDGASWRASYHRAMAEALGSAGVSPAPQEPGSKISPAEFFSPTTDASGAEGAPRRRERKIPPAEGFAPSPDPRLGTVEPLRESALVAAALYEKAGTTESYHRWARLEQSVRLAEQALRRPGPASSETLRSAVAALAADLLQAQDRHSADPSDANRRDWRRLQGTYEVVARRLDRLSARAVPPDRPETSSLADELLAAQDFYLADPNAATETAWRRARQAYERRLAPSLRRIHPYRPPRSTRRGGFVATAIVSWSSFAPSNGPSSSSRPIPPLARPGRGRFKASTRSTVAWPRPTPPPSRSIGATTGRPPPPSPFTRRPTSARPPP
jgi:hypothetical protein